MMPITSTCVPAVLYTAYLLTSLTVNAQTVVNSQCDVPSYYAAIDPNNEAALRTLVTSTHKKTLPRIGQKDEVNVLDALEDLDPGLVPTVDPTIRLYMRDIDFTAAQQNTPEGWKTGDVWPLKRGAAALGALWKLF